MFKYIREDIKNIVKKDPAARNGLEVLLCYPGIWALIFHKPAHFLYRHRVKLIARMISQFARFLTLKFIREQKSDADVSSITAWGS